MSFLLYSSIGYLVKSKESKSSPRIELSIEDGFSLAHLKEEKN